MEEWIEYHDISLNESYFIKNYFNFKKEARNIYKIRLCGLG